MNEREQRLRNAQFVQLCTLEDLHDDRIVPVLLHLRRELGTEPLPVLQIRETTERERQTGAGELVITIAICGGTREISDAWLVPASPPSSPCN